MGVSFSCSSSEFDDFDDFEALIVRSLSFKEEEEVKHKWRSLSFNGRDTEPTLLKSFGSGKMHIERSRNLTRKKLDPFHLESMFSFKKPSLNKEHSFKPEDRRIGGPLPSQKTLTEVAPKSPSVIPSSPEYRAALKLQKVYKSFRTRRRLADCAVLVEQHWWKLLDFALLKRNSVSFFNHGKQETAVSRWSRARTRAAMVGRGLSKDKKARKLALQHWLEAIDPRHRYGHNLRFYYVNWLQCESRQPFFYWLDVGDGREVSLNQCPRSNLQHQCIKYLGPKERQAYEVIVEGGKLLYKESRELLNTTKGDEKYIFVLSTSKRLYVGQKKKGNFQHSSFLAGGATSAAGRLVAEKGVLKAVWPHSGHYRPTEENFQEFISYLKKNNIGTNNVKITPMDEENSCNQQEASLRRNSSNLESDLSSWIHDGSRNNSRKLDSQPSDWSKLQTHFGLKGKSSELVDQSTTDLASDETNAEHDLESKQPCNSEKTGKIDSPTSVDKFERHENGGRATGGLSVEAQSEGPFAVELEYLFQKLNLFEEDEEQEEEVPREKILGRIKSKKHMKSYQLGKQLTCRWTTGAGPRIGCLRDYPTELQFRALEEVNLSPRSCSHSRSFSSLNMINASPQSLGISLLKESNCSSTSGITDSNNQ